MTRRRLLAVCATILVVSVAAYFPLRHHRFIQDDHPILQLNPVIHRGDLVEIFTTDYWAGVGGGDTSLYRPATLASFLPERDGKGRVIPERAHVTNVLLHALCSLLTLGLALRLGWGGWPATVAALLFAAHPLHLAAVAPLTGRAEILATTLGLCALLCQTGAGPWPGGRAAAAWRWRLASWGSGSFLFLAMASKETALAVPLLLVVLEALYRAPRNAAQWLARLTALGPAAVAVVAHLALRAAAVGSLFRLQSPPLSDNLLAGLAGWSSLATRLALLGRYVMQLLAPINLSADHSGTAIAAESGLLAARPLVGLVCLIALLACVARPLWSRGDAARRTAFAAWLFLAPYLVVGNLIVIVGVAYAERLAYFPSTGFCLLVGLLFGRALDGLGRRPAGHAATVLAGGLVAALVVAGVVHTHRASRDWENERTLFRAVLRVDPDNARAHFTLGKIELKDGHEDVALARFRSATRSWPDFSAAWYESGLILARRGDFEDAVSAFAEALRVNPRHPQARLYRAVALRRLGRLEEAERELRRTVRRHPGMTSAVAELASLLLQLNRPADALPWLREAVEQGRSDLEPLLRDLERSPPP